MHYFNMVAQTEEGSFVQMDLLAPNLKKALKKVKACAPECLVFPKPKEAKQTVNPMFNQIMDKQPGVAERLAELAKQD